MRHATRFGRVGAGVVVLCLVCTARAQYGADGQTNTIDGASVVWAGDYAVGSNTSGNVLLILNGGALTNVTGYLGFEASSDDALAVVDGAGSRWHSSLYMQLGHYGSGCRVLVTNGGVMTVANRTFIGRQYYAESNHLEVAGSGSQFRCANNFAVGQQGANNRMTVRDGGQVSSTLYGAVGFYSSGNLAVVSDAGSMWTTPTELYLSYGISHQNNRLIVTNGGWVADKDAYIGYDDRTAGNAVVVTGAGSVWTNSGGASAGWKGSFNRLDVADGGTVVADGMTVGTFAGANSNRVTVSGAGSFLRIVSNLEMGRQGKENTLTVTNGARMYGRYCLVGSFTNGNRAVVSGPGTRWEYFTLTLGKTGNDNRLEITDGAEVAGPAAPSQYSVLSVGSVAGATGNRITVDAGCLLEANNMIVTNEGNTIVNYGGIYQFSSATPSLTTNGLASVSPIVLTNGIISFRAVANAPLGPGTHLTRIAYQGDNGYRLNGATNASVASYTFDAVANTGDPARFQRLILTGVNPRWQGTALTFGAGGAMRVESAQASVGAAVTNHGTLAVSDAVLTLEKQAVVNGTVEIDLDRLADTNGVVRCAGLALGPSCTLRLTRGGAYTNEHAVTLFRHAGTRTGLFATEEGVPPKYKIHYGPETDGAVRLIPEKVGTVMRLH